MSALKGPEVFVPKIHRAQGSCSQKWTNIVLYSSETETLLQVSFCYRPTPLAKIFSFVDMLKASKVHLE